MSGRITGLDVLDVRFPTSLELAGSDATNPQPDYSAAYVVLRTDTGLSGRGLAFTIGRGTDVQVAAIRAFEPLVAGLDVDEVLGDLGGFARMLVWDSPMRWLGPEKGVVHMAVGAVVNAAWDLYAVREGKPLWKLLADLSPRQLVGLVDFHYLTDVLEPAEALEILERARAGSGDRERRLLAEGFPAYTSSVGWLGYPDEKVARLAKEAVASGFTHLKLKVGAGIDADVRRCRLVRDLVGPDVLLSVDANQHWDVGEAVGNVHRLDEVGLWWVEEPTSPDDVFGHRAIADAVTPVKVATGEHVPNRVVFKQLLAGGAIDVCQIDACRVGGVNENVAILLLAAKFGVPVCPHAGGVGLCEIVQHLSMFDFVAVSGSTEERWIEYVDHLHEHFVDPVRIHNGRYLAPTSPGSGVRMHDTSLADHAFPQGRVWRELLASEQTPLEERP